MMNNKPITIAPKKTKLTPGQIALLSLMKKRIEANETISREDIFQIYRNHVQRCEVKEPQYKFWQTDDNGERKLAWGTIQYSSNELNQYCKLWLERALGQLILQEKLIAIPVFET